MNDCNDLKDLLDNLNKILHNIEDSVINPIKKFDNEWKLDHKPRCKSVQRNSNLEEIEAITNNSDTITDPTCTDVGKKENLNVANNPNETQMGSQDEGNQETTTTVKSDICEVSGVSQSKVENGHKYSDGKKEGEANKESQCKMKNTAEITSEKNQIQKNEINDINKKQIKETGDNKLIKTSKMNFESMKELNHQRQKIMRRECQCIVFGETSAGKTTLINALLNRDDLPVKCGRTTNCFVEIALKNETCLMIEDEEKDFKLLKDLITYTSKNHLKNGSHVRVFYKREDCSFLKENMTIIDIPGIDTDADIDKQIVKYCTEADIIILVINATLCVKGTVKKFINEFQTRFTELNFFLVFNHCDQLEEEDEIEKIKDQLVKGAENVFRGELKYSIDIVGDRTFFISARDRMRINKNKEYMKGDTNRESRNEEFNRLITKIEETVSIDGFKRRYKYLEELYNVVEKNIKECESLIIEIKKNMLFISNESIKILNNFNYSIKEMDKVTNSAFCSIIKKLKDIKSKKTESQIESSLTATENIEDKSLNITNEPENVDSTAFKWLSERSISYDTREAKRVNNITEPDHTLYITDKTQFRRIIMDWLFEEIGKDFEDVKTEIIECIKLNKNDYLSSALIFLEKLYFPFYLKKEIDLAYSVKDDDKNPINMIESPVDLDQIMDKTNQMNGTEILKEIINYLYNVTNAESNELKLEINKINNLNKDNQRIPILILENLLYLCFVDTRVQSLDPRIERLIYKWIQKELNEKYSIFVNQINNNLFEQFERKFGNSSNETIEKIKADLNQVKNKMDCLEKQIPS